MENKSQADSLLDQAREIEGNLSVALKQEKEELKNSAIFGFLLSVAGFFGLGLLLYLLAGVMMALLRIHDTFNLSLGMYFLIYPVIFLSLIFLAQSFETKEEYYLGETWGETF